MPGLIADQEAVLVHNCQYKAIEHLVRYSLMRRQQGHKCGTHSLIPPYLGYKGFFHSVCRTSGKQLSRHIVDINTALGPRELDGPIKIVPLLLPVGINEDHVESTALLGQLREDIEGSAENGFNIKALQVFHCNLSVLGIDFNTTNFSARLGKPDGGVAAERADLKDGLGADGLALNGKTLTLQGRYGDWG
jgi:hypothetical protein